MSFDFSVSYIVYNNLGGHGPDGPHTPPVIRFVNVGTVSLPDGTSFNFDIEMSNRSQYVPSDPSINGYASGAFACVNLASNHHVDLRATLFMSCSTRPSCRICTESGYDVAQRIRCFAAGCSCYGEMVTTEAGCSTSSASAARASYTCPQMYQALVLPSAALASMTVYDLDTDASGTYLEQLTVPGYEYFRTPLRPSSGNIIQSTIFVNHALRMFTGTGVGQLPDTADMPTSPQALSDDEASKGVQFFFRPQYGYIDVTFTVVYSGYGSGTGRSLLFAGDSALCPSPPPLPPASPPRPPPPLLPPPSPPPLSPPPPSPAPPSRPPYPPCGTRVDLNLYNGCPNGRAAVENLGGLGPDTGAAHELRYARVGSFNGRPFDLVVTLAGGTLSPPPQGRVYSGCRGQFGMVSILAGTQVDLQFAFHDNATNVQVTLPSFAFSIFDLDVVERVQIDSFSAYTLRQPETNVIDEGAGSCEAQGQYGTPCRAFRSCRLENECVYPADVCPGQPSCTPNVQNPDDPTALTERQMAASITFDFMDTSSFNIRWGEAFNPRNPYAARLFFAGASNLVPV